MACTYRAGLPCPQRQGFYDLVCCRCRRSLQVLSTWHPDRGEGTAADILHADPGGDLGEALLQHERRCKPLDEAARRTTLMV